MKSRNSHKSVGNVRITPAFNQPSKKKVQRKTDTYQLNGNFYRVMSIKGKVVVVIKNKVNIWSNPSTVKVCTGYGWKPLIGTDEQSYRHFDTIADAVAYIDKHDAVEVEPVKSESPSNTWLYIKIVLSVIGLIAYQYYFFTHGQIKSALICLAILVIGTGIGGYLRHKSKNNT